MDDTKYLPDWLRNSGLVFGIVTGIDGKIHFCNKAFQTRFTIQEGQDSIADFVEKTDREYIKSKLNRFSGSEIDSYVLKFTAYDPVTAVKIKLAWEISSLNGGELYIWIGTEESDSDSAKLEAKSIGDRLELFIESISDGFYILDSDFRFIKSNQMAHQLTGIPREVVLGKVLWDTFPVEPEFNYRELYERAAFDKQAIHFIDYRNDLQKWMSVDLYPFDGGLMVFFRDVTREQLHQKLIQESDHKLKAIYESTTDASYFISNELRINFFNKAAKKLFESQLKGDIGEGDSIYSCFPEEWENELFRMIIRVREGESPEIEMEYNFLWYHVLMNPVYNEANKMVGIAINIKDISLAKNNMIRILRQNEMLRKIAWQQSHEVRKPLANILGLLDLLKADLSKSDSDPYIEYLYLSAHELDTAVRTIVNSIAGESKG